MRCPYCCVGELKLGRVRGLSGVWWHCVDVGRGWNTNYPQRAVTQKGYCGMAVREVAITTESDATAVREEPPMDTLQEMAWEDNNARSLGLL